MTKKILLIFILIVGVCTLTLLAMVVRRLPLAVITNLTKTETSGQPVVVTNKAEDKSKGIWRDVMETKLSPSGNYLAYLVHYTRDGVESIELYVTEQNNEYFVKRDSMQTTWKVDANDETYSHRFINWSPDGKYLAAIAGKNLIVVSFTNLGSEQYRKEVVLPKIVFDGQLDNWPTGYMGIWFENGTLQASMFDGVYEIWPKTEKIVSVEHQNGIYPSGENYVFWRLKDDCCEVDLFETDKDGNVTDTGLTIVDYFGIVLADPTGQRLCVEHGSSGYYGYHLYDLANKKSVENGQQYSYCGQWLDATHLSLIEIPYYDQWSRQVYIYDWTTHKREPVVSMNNSEINPYIYLQP